MKFGILFSPQDPPNAEHIVERWQQILEAAEVAEEAGFDGLFLPEHHMLPDGYLPSPWAALGALAARTERVEIGSTIHVLPLQNPIQVAEAGAMVDVLSNGRFRMGVGLGHFDPEFELFGVNPKTQVSRFEESLDLIDRAWAGEVIDHEGKHFKLKGGPVTPSPVAAEVWLGATSEPGVKRAARRGKPWITDYLHNVDVIDRWAKIYREAAAEHGTPEKARICMLRQGWVGDSLEQVERDWWPHMRQDNWFYFSQIPRYVADLEPWVASVEKEEDFVFERHLVDRMIVGSPEECIAGLRRFEQAIDPEYMIMTFRAAEGPSFEQELACIRRFGAEVIPAFGS